MAEKISLGILISGSGTNLQAIIDNCAAGRIDAKIKVVISNKSDAYGLIRAEKAGIETEIHKRKNYGSKKDFEEAIAKALKKRNVDLVCLAGFMRILSPDFLRNFPGKTINIHPALLPSFPGLHAQKQAFDYGVKMSGCTVHFVDEGTDTGPIILQTAVPVKKDDTEETLAKRILIEEHKIYSHAIQLFAEQRLEIRGRRVVIMDRTKE